MMLFGMLRAFERYDAAALPPLHRLALLVLADLADERAHVRVDTAAVAAFAKRMGVGVREARALVAELSAALWLERDPRQKASSSPVYVVRLEGGRIVRRRPDAPTPSLAGEPGA